MPITAPEGYLDISNATLRGSEIITTSNVGVMNANPTMALSVGSNLHVNIYSSNVLQVSGNIVSQGLNVGFIEIIPPKDFLAVSNVGNTTTSTIQFANATTAFVTLSNVGIGTDSPAHTLDVNGNVQVGTANLFVDTTTGAVGIGTLSPAHTLDVNGNVQVGTANLFVDTTTGTVGIGTTTPAQALEVSGKTRVSNVSDSSFFSDMYAYQVPGSSWSQQAKLVASDPTAYDYLGYSVAISSDGNTAIVGVQYGDDPIVGTDVGSAYIFTRSGSSWTQQQEIKASDAAPGDYFGYSVSISSDGNTVIVGAPIDNSTAGSAYIFTRSGGTWTQQQKITASDAAADDYFGWSVSISSDGNTVIVGAYKEDNTATDAGSAYIFTRSGSSWSQQQKIIASDAAYSSGFGYSVAISGDGNTAIAGAYIDDPGGVGNAGSAYIFTRSGSTWTQQQKITASDGANSDLFGSSVSISSDGNTAIVGAWRDTVTYTQQGSAYIFTYSGGSWSEQQKITASDAADYDNFGESVAISGDGNTAIVGVRYEDPGNVSAAGSAYIFTRSGSTWSEQQKITASDGAQNDRFGNAVAISSDGNTAIVGAYYEDPGGVTDAGSAYIFTKALPYITLGVSTSITADGTLLSFTGQHMCFPDGPMSEGLVVSANKNKYLNLNGPLTTGLGAIKSSESLPVVTLSNVTNDRSVFGVVDRLESGGTVRNQTTGITIVNATKELGDNRVIVNAIGEGAMWVANTNGNLVSGDYITTSNIAGYGQKQDSEFLANYTVAKITMDCDFNPEDLPVQVIKKDAEGKNVLDTYGRLQWEDTDRTQKAYKIRYLTVDGTQTDQANAVHIAAFVGCTYHCG